MTDKTHASGLATRKHRHDAGKALRDRVSRESLATFHVDRDRDPLPILTASDPQRVPSLVPERYLRMAQSAFAFYRGGAALMAHDLTLAPAIGLPVQACGDCHLMNFGVFSSPEGNVLFDINDFDETYPGVDFVVDLKRLVASVAVAAKDAGMADEKAQALAESTAKAYRDFMRALGEQAPLDVWQTRMELKDQLAGLNDADLETKLLKTLCKAQEKEKDFKERPDVEEATMTFREKARTAKKKKKGAEDEPLQDGPPRIFHVMPDGTPVRTMLTDAPRKMYEASLAPECAMLLRRYALRDVAFKIVGVGSVGTYCAIGLWATADGDTMILQVKQAWQSAIAGLGGGTLVDAQQGKRVVDGQRALQAASDPFLGWMQDDTGRQFYIRQLKNRRLGSISETIESKALPAYATLCGRTLARAHARTGDPVMISGYLGGSATADKALAEFAMAYTQQNGFDFEKLAASSLVPKTSATA